MKLACAGFMALIGVASAAKHAGEGKRWPHLWEEPWNEEWDEEQEANLDMKKLNLI